MKKRVLLLSIDGLGLGATPDVKYSRPSDVGANTLRSLLKTKTQLTVLSSINLLSLDDEKRPIRYKDYNIQSGKSALKYRGADSFLGHAEMIGINIDLKPIYLDDYIYILQKKLVELFGFKKIDIFSGLMVVDRTIFISNNMECDPGYSINVIIDNKNKKIDRDSKIINIIKSIVPISRILLIYGNGVTYSKVKKSVIHKVYLNNTYFGVAVPLLNIYNEGYSVTHNSNISFSEENLLSTLYNSGVNICLIGKPSYLFPKQEYIKIDVTDTKNILDQTIKKWKEYDYLLLFVNIQDIDLGGHACNALKGASCLKTIDLFLSEFLPTLEQDDMLVVTADHGNDPQVSGQNHTREYVPVIAVGKSIHGRRLNIQPSLSCVSNIVAKFFEEKRKTKTSQKG